MDIFAANTAVLAMIVMISSLQSCCKVTALPMTLIYLLIAIRRTLRWLIVKLIIIPASLMMFLPSLKQGNYYHFSSQQLRTTLVWKTGKKELNEKGAL
ncbi:hypothetical protein X975_11389, partial [Stegodyphus mimosarum]